MTGTDDNLVGLMVWHNYIILLLLSMVLITLKLFLHFHQGKYIDIKVFILNSLTI